MSAGYIKLMRVAEVQSTLGFKHDYQPLNEKVLEVIKPIYEDLSRDDLLKNYSTE